LTSPQNQIDQKVVHETQLENLSPKEASHLACVTDDKIKKTSILKLFGIRAKFQSCDPDSCSDAECSKGPDPDMKEIIREFVR